jgi:very-short-patch-repair endonuclease
VVTGRSAAWLWRVDVDGPEGAARSTSVEVTVRPGGNARVPGLVVRRRTLREHEVGCPPWLRDVPTLWPVHAALEIAADPARSHVESVVVLDQFCESAPVNLASLRAAAAGWTGRGCRGLQAALLDADGLAGSPPETRLRLGMRAAGLPVPVAQYRRVKASGQKVKLLDFAWPHLRLGVEYDGSGHVGTSTRPEGRFGLPKDRRVLNEVQERGWQLFYVTAPDQHDVTGVVARIGAALAARAAQLGVPLHPPA